MYTLPELSRRRHTMQVIHAENSCPSVGVCEKFSINQPTLVQYLII